jgi:putative flippase GtrA
MEESERSRTSRDGVEDVPVVARWPLSLAGGLLLLLAIGGSAMSAAFGIPWRALLYLGLLTLIIILGRPASRGPLSAQMALLPAASAARQALDALGASGGQSPRLARWRVFGTQLLRYLLVGTTTTLLDFGILNLLLQLVPATTPMQVALYAATSYGTTLAIAYLWHRQWTFRDGGRQRAIAWRFVLLNGLTLSVNALVVLLLTSTLPLVLPLSALVLANISKGVATAASGALNFLGNRAWVFQATQPRRQPRLERDTICEAMP